MPVSENDTSKEKQVNSGWLGWIERVGNRLPDPATLFLIGTVLVMIASAVAVKSGWVVHERLPDHAAALGQAARTAHRRRCNGWRPVGLLKRTTF